MIAYFQLFPRCGVTQESSQEKEGLCGNALMEIAFEQQEYSLLRLYGLRKSERGAALFEENCKVCHGVEKRGVGEPLAQKVDSLTSNEIYDVVVLDRKNHIRFESFSRKEIDSLVEYVRYQVLRNQHTMDNL